MMPRYWLSVLLNVPGDGRIATVVHVYTIEVAQPIQWVRTHADELAQRCIGHSGYCALMVASEPPRA